MPEPIKLVSTIIFWVAFVILLLLILYVGFWLLLGYAFTGSEQIEERRFYRITMSISLEGKPLEIEGTFVCKLYKKPLSGPDQFYRKVDNRYTSTTLPSGDVIQAFMPDLCSSKEVPWDKIGTETVELTSYLLKARPAILDLMSCPTGEVQNDGRFLSKSLTYGDEKAEILTQRAATLTATRGEKHRKSVEQTLRLWPIC